MTSRTSLDWKSPGSNVISLEVLWKWLQVAEKSCFLYVWGPTGL